MRNLTSVGAVGVLTAIAAMVLLDPAAGVGAGQDSRGATRGATSKPEEVPGFVRGKYRGLLRKLYVPDDIKTDGEVHDYGWWTGKAWGGYSDLPPGYWVYSAPHWYIFAEKIGEVSPLAGWSLFKNVDANCGLPDALVKAYAQYAKFAKAGDAGGFRSACLPQGVTISNDARPKEREEYGEGINIPFVKKAFQQDVQSVRKDSESCWLVRTNSTAIWFVETARDGWRVYQVLDKPASAQSWPTPRAAEAIRDGTLVLQIVDAPRTITAFQRIDVQIKVLNNGKEPVEVPANWPALLGVEIARAGGSAAMSWTPEVNQETLTRCVPLEPGRDAGLLFTVNWMAQRPLKGRPKEQPYLAPGTYRWRYVMAAEPALGSNWRPLTVTAPALSEQAKAAGARRPAGRLLLVDGSRKGPKTLGTLEHPFQSIAEALRCAKAGDVIFCEPGFYADRGMVVPDDVWLVGAGASSTRLTAIEPAGLDRLTPVLTLEGRSRLEGMLVISSDGRDKGNGPLVLSCGKQSAPTIFQCALVAGGGTAEAMRAWEGAAPSVRNCILVSAVEGYALLSRYGAKPALEYCTVVSRGFGVSTMDQSVPTLKRCILAGRCPAILAEADSEYGISECVIWCPAATALFASPGMRTPRGPQDLSRAEVIPGLMQRKDVRGVDPKFGLTDPLEKYLVPARGEAAAYGAYAGPDGNWPAALKPGMANGLPNLRDYLKAE